MRYNRESVQNNNGAASYFLCKGFIDYDTPPFKKGVQDDASHAFIFCSAVK